MEELSEEKESLLLMETTAPEVYRQLDQILRTGWVMRGVENPESVKEHTIALLELATEMWDELSEAEQNGLLEMLEIHDWPEAIHGDEVILELDEEVRKVLKDAKFENEKRAMQTICADLPNGEYLFHLWMRYETSNDPAVIFGRQLDKYQAVEKALGYEKDQGILMFREFVEYASNFITHPLLLAKLQDLETQSAEMNQNTKL